MPHPVAEDLSDLMSTLSGYSDYEQKALNTINKNLEVKWKRLEQKNPGLARLNHLPVKDRIEVAKQMFERERNPKDFRDVVNNQVRGPQSGELEQGIDRGVQQMYQKIKGLME